MTGVGKSILSKMTALFGSQRVSPVTVSLSPTIATMSPDRASFTSVRSFASNTQHNHRFEFTSVRHRCGLPCICNMRPILSGLPFTELRTVDPAASTPEYIRVKVRVPTKGSFIILKARAAKGTYRSPQGYY